MSTDRRKVSGRELRRQLKEQSDVAQTVNTNEKITRQRVDALEDFIKVFTHRSLKERLRWLILGL